MTAALLALALAAPAPLHLSDLLREVEQKNPDLEAARAKVRASSTGIAPAGALEDPMLMVQVWNAPADFSTVPVMVHLGQTLPLGGKRAARTDAARADLALAEAELAGRLQDLQEQIAMAWFDLFLAERTLEVDDELDQILQVLLASSEARVSTGKAEPVELLRTQAAIVQLKSERETAIDHRRSAWARLSSLLDRDPDLPEGATTSPARLSALPDLRSLQARALQQRPELAGARAAIEGAKAQERLAHASEVPDLGLFAAVMHTFRNDSGPSNFIFAGAQVNLPLFSGAKNSPRIASASAQVVGAQEAARGVANRIAAEVSAGHAHLLAEAHQIDLHHQLIPLSRQAVESAESSYGAGRTDFTMVLDSARELRLHELELAQHLAAYEQRLAELQRAVGGDLGLAQAAEAGHAEAH